MVPIIRIKSTKLGRKKSGYRHSCSNVRFGLRRFWRFSIRLFFIYIVFIWRNPYILVQVDRTHCIRPKNTFLSPHRKFVMDESKADSENHASGSQMDVASSTTMPTKNSNRKRLHQNAIAILEGNHGDHFNALDI